MTESTRWGEVFDDLNPLVTGTAVDDGVGPPTLSVEVDLDPVDGSKSLPRGGRGPRGRRGVPGPPTIWKGEVTGAGALPDDLTPDEYGWMYTEPVSGDVWVWEAIDGEPGFRYFAGALGAPGPDGQPVGISVGTVTTTLPGGALEVTPSGVEPNQQLNFAIPRGNPGPEGDPGPGAPISTADDVSGSASAGDVLIRNPTNTVWQAGPPRIPIGDYTLINSDFSTSTITGASGVVTTANLNIAPAPFPYRFEVDGGLLIAGSTASVYAAGVVVVSDNRIIAYGERDRRTNPDAVTIRPWLSQKVTPGSSVGRYPADTPQQLYVYLARLSGSNNYNVQSSSANSLRVRLLPA